MNYQLYLLGYKFAEHSHLDGAILGGLEGALLGFGTAVLVDAAINAKEKYDMKIKNKSKDDAKADTKKVRNIAKYIVPAVISAGLIFGSICPEKTYDSMVKINKPLNKAAYSLTKKISNAVHK
jgi:hypothetical protein